MEALPAVRAAVAEADTTVAEVATLVVVAASVAAEVLAVAVPQEAEAAAGVGKVLWGKSRTAPTCLQKKFGISPII